MAAVQKNILLLLDFAKRADKIVAALAVLPAPSFRNLTGSAVQNRNSLRWCIKKPDSQVSQAIGQALNLSVLVSQLLVNRGLDTPEKAAFFLSADLADLPSPFLMKGMDAAVLRIAAAVQRQERICVYGDYDVDGITATAIVVGFLQELRADVFFYMPHRLHEGYGLNIEAVKQIKAQGARLIITVDCGIADADPASFAQAQGMDVIITDHHEVPDRPAAACAVVNPKQPGCSFPFKSLAGVGVAFNLLLALRKTMRDQGSWRTNGQPNLKKYLDLVAMGTIADVVPMVDENRIFVRNGLGLIAEGRRPGLRALKTVSGISQGEVSAHMVSFRLAPRLNASGRLADASKAVHLLLAADHEEAMPLARCIDEENTRRQEIERRILAAAKAMLPAEGDLPWSIVLSSEEWHQGVIGLCASRLCEQFRRPTVLIAVDAARGEAHGSARSIQGFDMYEALKRCRSVLRVFGGHKAAAGFALPAANIMSFMEKFNAVARAELAEAEFLPVMEIDAEVDLRQLSYDVLEEIESLAPFGPANPEPVFSCRDITSYSAMVVGRNHLKLKIRADGLFFDAIGFNMGSIYSLQDQAISLAFVPQFNIFNGEKIIQLNLKDIKGL